jgi:ABC-type transport system substrate-binding protein
LTQADRLMQSAGLVKQSDRSYTTADGKRFGFELRGAASDQDAREAAINANAWKELGIDVQTRLLSTEEVKDGELRSNYPAFIDADTAGIAEDTVYVKLYSLNAASAATRWQGSNRGGHSNPEYDRFFVTLTTNLERTAQVDAIVQAAKFVSEQVPIIPLYYSYNVKAHVSALKGPQTYAPTGSVTWGVEEWTFAG